MFRSAYRMRRAALILMAAMSTVVAAAPAPQPDRLDRILVIVNDDVITESELTARLAQVKVQLSVDGIKAPPDAVLQKQLVERMISEKLQLELANRAGIDVTDAEVESAVKELARNNKMSPEDFRRRLVREGLDPQAHMEEIRSQLIIRQLLDREVRARVNVSDSEIATFLDTQTADSGIEYNLSHIFLPLPESASPETIQNAKKRADDVLRQLKDGAKFDQLAVTYSQGEGALSGGAIGWKKGGQLPELFLTAVKDLVPGNTSGVLRGPNGFHILKLNNRRGGGVEANVKQTHVRHILLRRNELQSATEVRAKLSTLRQRIVHGEDFSTLAKANSEDPGSASKGGDLGWVSPGALVPEFEKAMETLKPGEISLPVESPYGLHIIQVVDRRTQDMSDERLRAAARQQILARKASERYEQWARQIRDEAYVEYVNQDTN
jgi:peptidyl-prolyl cis-trans isomerase SurA